ncbi:MAG: tRNA uridine-5-carboxymethylaminomethyl(34) synthesis GTPase MnmE, partial [Clostridia bacterium]|nr:tRNA uridine-5-carboxymethylaminomethyl(34) synthesis GTPase MnmE [Clostridia bacterium]
LYVTKRVLRAVLKNGAVPAEAGEFTKRAFLNGKLGLTEAEAVMDIISAKGSQSARAALSCMEGKLRQRIDSVRDTLINTAAHLSAWADYPEEDIPEVDTDNLTSSLSVCRDELSALLRTYDTGKIMREGVETVIAGRPNVGKSTIMNLLSGCERSIVTNVPGTTRDVIEETVMLGEIPLRLSDTAGIRSTDDPVEKIGVERAKDRILKAGLVLAVFDSSRPLSDDDKELIELLSDAPSLAIINKTDLEKQLDTDYIQSKIKHVIFISALSGEGTAELEKQVADIIGTAELDASQGILATERQHRSAQSAMESLNEAITALSSGITLDAVTVIIEDAINYLLELTGERVTEAVVDKVFSHFCVGK